MAVVLARLGVRLLRREEEVVLVEVGGWLMKEGSVTG